MDFLIIPKIHWKNGIFNSGVFGNEGLNTATWSGGIFNNGEFIIKPNGRRYLQWR
jgi:hypothetical protein